MTIHGQELITPGKLCMPLIFSVIETTICLMLGRGVSQQVGNVFAWYESDDEMLSNVDLRWQQNLPIGGASVLRRLLVQHGRRT